MPNQPKPKPAATIVIRNYNEAKTLKPLLADIAAQNYPETIEILVVDNESTDNSRTIAKEGGARVITLPRDEFTYPKASNYGIHHAEGEIIGFVSAHNQIPNQQWIAASLQHFKDPDVVGVYGPNRARTDAPMFEKIYYNNSLPFASFNKTRVLTKTKMDTMGATNCFIRKSYWQTNPYDEAFAGGGEDRVWADTALTNGKKIVHEPRAYVNHSHKLKFPGLVRQHLYWMSLRKPRSFDRSVIDDIQNK